MTTTDFKYQLFELQRKKVEEKKLDLVKNSEVFKGFTREEIKELLIEMPELRKAEKMKDKPPKHTFKS